MTDRKSVVTEEHYFSGCITSQGVCYNHSSIDSHVNNSNDNNDGNQYYVKVQVCLNRSKCYEYILPLPFAQTSWEFLSMLITFSICIHWYKCQKNRSNMALSKKVTYLVYITGKTRDRVNARDSLIRHTNGVTRISLFLCSISYILVTAVPHIFQIQVR